MSKRFSSRMMWVLMGVWSLGFLWAQGDSYLAQKLMVENDLRQRITQALSKIIEGQKYVVDVSVELDITGEAEEQLTLQAGELAAQTTAPVEGAALTKELEAKTAPTPEAAAGGISGGLPIPGFDFEMEPEPTAVESAPAESPAEETKQPAVAEATPEGPQVLSRTITNRRPAIAKIKRQEIRILLDEDAPPELIENIRQVVMVTSRYNRARGDLLSIMTATFKERRDERTAEQVMLKNIAQKIDALESKRQAEDAAQEQDWRKELEEYKKAEADRREEDRLYFQSKLTELEIAARERAFNKEKQEILKRDSLELQRLNQEIQALKAKLGSPELSVEEATQTETTVEDLETRRKQLEEQINEKMSVLEGVKTELDRTLEQGGMGTSTLTVVFVSLLAALVIVLIIILVILVTNRSKQQVPPPWMYPPRPRKKKSKKAAAPAPQVTTTTTTPPPAQPAPQPAIPEPEEDPGVLQSEIDDMKQAVVSMSVGQPHTATRIVKEWLEEEAPPPPPQPETPAPPPPAEEEDSGKKKKKKKKK